MSATAFTAPAITLPSLPDLAWIRRNVPIQDVARDLDLRVIHNRARCWRAENHANADQDPSIRFLCRSNRARCFVCDLRGGFSNIDLVIGVLGCDLPTAVAWICERFVVPEAKPGRPVGSRSKLQPQIRIGVSGSDLETFVRSGLLRELPSPEVRILLVLHFFRDPDTGLTVMSYRALMRYAGVRSSHSVSKALSHLGRIRALQKHRAPRWGITRDCSSYRVTLEDPKLRDLCNETFRKMRDEGEHERAYRRELRAAREKQAAERDFGNLRSRMKTAASNPSPIHHVDSLCVENQPQLQGQSQNQPCKGLNLSSLSEVRANKSLQLVKREKEKKQVTGVL